MISLTFSGDYDALVREIDRRRDAIRLAGAVVVGLEVGWQQYALIHQERRPHDPDGPRLKTFLGLTLTMMGEPDHLVVLGKHPMQRWIRGF